MDNQLSNNKKIAKNTFFLYVRMMLMLVISLYTSRVVLDYLGVQDFGIYNLIGGVVVLFSFLNNALTSSTQRFLNYNITNEDNISVRKVFSTSIHAHFIIALVVSLLAETIGLWFVYNYLNIPYNRMETAVWVYQFSVLTTIASIIRVPYHSAFIASEDMGVFAYLSIIESLLKLLTVYLLVYAPDRLFFYSFLQLVISLVLLSTYIIIALKKYSFCHYINVHEKNLLCSLLGFSGWMLFGGASMVLTKQGVNIIINIFLGVIVNAAVGIANQVKNAINGFITSFQTAFAPQIVKLYATGQQKELDKLISFSTKISFALYIAMSFPVILVADKILSIWLIDVPEYAVGFTRWILVATLFDTLSAPLWTVIGATGKIKWYQILVSLIISAQIPFIWGVLKMGASPMIVFVIETLFYGLAYIFRCHYIIPRINLSIKLYCKNIIAPIIAVLFILMCLYIGFSFIRIDGMVMTILVIISSLLLTILSTLTIVFAKTERESLFLFLKQKISK